MHAMTPHRCCLALPVLAVAAVLPSVRGWSAVSGHHSEVHTGARSGGAHEYRTSASYHDAAPWVPVVPVAPAPALALENRTLPASPVHLDHSGYVFPVVPTPRPTASTTSRSAPMQAEASASSSAYLHRSLTPSNARSTLASRSRSGRLGSYPGLTGTPSSYSYFMQVQPHPRSSAYRERTRQSVHVVNLLPQSSPSTQAAAQSGEEAHGERLPFTGPAFRSFPFGNVKVPSTFSHGNPLAGHYRRPPAPAGLPDDHPAKEADPFGFVAAGSYFRDRDRPPPVAREPARQRRPKVKPASATDIAVLGDPRQPNLGIVGVPGQGQYVHSPPRVREYDPYTGRFKVVATEDGHDSREGYRRPGASAEDSAESDVDAAGRDSLKEEESYEVYETPDETPSVVAAAPMRGSVCSQKDFLSGLLSPLLNAVRPANKCQKQQRQQQRANFASLHRPRARPPRRKKPVRHRKQPQRQQQQLRQREPYFEFRNPVHSYISGEPMQVQGRLLGAENGDHDDNADAEYLAMGDAEREAYDDAEQRQLLDDDGEGHDADTFAPYSVYHTIKEPDRKFRPFVPFPFEAERSNLKTMVNDLIHEGHAQP